MKHQTKIAIISVVLVMPIANVQSTEIQQKFNSSTSNQLNQADKHLTSRGTRTVQTPQENRNGISHHYNSTSKKNNVRRGTRANHYEMLSAKPVGKRDKIIRRGNRASKS